MCAKRDALNQFTRRLALLLFPAAIISLRINDRPFTYLYRARLAIFSLRNGREAREETETGSIEKACNWWKAVKFHCFVWNSLSLFNVYADSATFRSIGKVSRDNNIDSFDVLTHWRGNLGFRICDIRKWCLRSCLSSSNRLSFHFPLNGSYIDFFEEKRAAAKNIIAIIALIVKLRVFQMQLKKK